MKVVFIIIISLMLGVSSFAAYDVGDVCEDLSWTTEEGETTSIYEQVDLGKMVMIFFGQTW